MKLRMFFAFAATAACAFATDGQILINQATVMAAGGFPYVISQPGSYKLSGNLTMSTPAQGYVAIRISSSNVSLDLNGFSIIINDTPVGLGTTLFAIAETGSFRQISISNGMISMTSSELSVLTAIYVPTSFFVTFQNLTFSMEGVTGIAAIRGGSYTLAVHNTGNGGLTLMAPCLIAENVGLVVTTTGCTVANNAN